MDVLFWMMLPCVAIYDYEQAICLKGVLDEGFKDKKIAVATSYDAGIDNSLANRVQDRR